MPALLFKELGSIDEHPEQENYPLTLQRLYAFGQTTARSQPLVGTTEAMVINTQLESPVFEESLFGVVLSAFPLQMGFKAKLPPLAPRRRDKSFFAHWVEVAVKKQESIKVGGKAYLCWVVDVDYLDIDYQEELWVTKQPPYLVKKKTSSGSKIEAKKVTEIDCCL